MRNARKEIGKYIGSFTARGKGDETQDTGTPIRIRLFDGKFDTAFKITRFEVWAESIQDTYDQRVSGKLATSPNCSTLAATFMDAADSREIAWAGQGDGSIDEMGPVVHIIDRENLVVEDLWVYLRTNQETGEERVNYYIEMDKYDITESLGALSMAKDRARDSKNEWVDQ